MLGRCPECGYDADAHRGPYTEADEFRLVEHWWKRRMAPEPFLSRNVGRLMTTLAYGLNDVDLWVMHGHITRMLELRTGRAL